MFPVNSPAINFLKIQNRKAKACKTLHAFFRTGIKKKKKETKTSLNEFDKYVTMPLYDYMLHSIIKHL